MESKKYKSVPKLEQKYSETKATLAQLIAVNVNNILLVSNGMTSGYPTIVIPGLLADKSNTIPIEEHEISWIGVAVCNVIAGIYAYAIDVKYLQFQNETTEIYSSSNAWLPLCALVSMAFIGHVGLRVIAWALIGEVFSNETRAVGCGIGGAVFFLLSFFANKTFLSIASIMEISGIYWFHAGVCILGFIIMYFFLPETEGKDLQEVINHFAGISKLDNKVK
ncbi:hypothetical protein RN001_008713 [Aquatica leii]|uniref:Major facilitator superfamily (MFS) profile domain-containing protein n=1 Tax=Aquatica leii TaxID=1421715 RepID=A0AAN7PZE3_9COLE|nr:hypothetical protein RN001_008713 [Aquatica leii]